MLAVGQVVNNRYRIAETLGRGGMGSVFKARDDTLNRFVAIKELRLDPGSSPQARAQVQQQFLQEAQVLANMNHPGLPRVTDYFTWAGNEYLVMDFIEGGSLSILLAGRAGKPFEEAQVLGWARQLLDALAYCHAHGVIHRDIKPQNLVLTPDGHIVLVDFGLAKLLGVNEVVNTKTALRGLGTPEYAPPEQYDAVSGHTDPRSDIYAVGATLYHLLTGQPPPTATLRLAKPNVFVLPPTWHAMISPATQAAVLKALRIPQAERFATVGEMQAALFPAGTSLYGLGYTPASAIPPTSVQSTALATPSPFGPSGNTPSSGLAPAGSRGLRSTYMMLALAGVMFLAVTGGTLAGAYRLAAGAMARARPATTAPAAEAGARAFAGTPTAAPPAATDTPASGATLRVRAMDGQAMVFVPGGSYTVGAESDDAEAASNEKPAHVVVLKGFWIDRTEISNALFLQFTQTTGYVTEAEKRGLALVWYKGQWAEQPGGDWRHPYGPGSSINTLLDQPVAAMAWNDAQAYCEWAGAQLPTEAQWEAAARGAQGNAWPWGAVWDGTRLNYCDTSCPDQQMRDGAADDTFPLTAPVGAFTRGASPFGALNLAGNVAEWVSDWYGPDYYAQSPRNDPAGPESGDRKVFRGGSWYAPQSRVRPTLRAASDPGAALGNVGFRCAQQP